MWMCMLLHFRTLLKLSQKSQTFFYTMAAEQPTLRARARLNLGMEFRLGDSCIGGMLPSGNRGEQKASQVLHILEDGGKSSSSVREA